MLILVRKSDQAIVIEHQGETCEIRILQVERDRVKLGIENNERFKVLRSELLEVPA